jgi:hypothetical protein
MHTAGEAYFEGARHAGIAAAAVPLHGMVYSAARVSSGGAARNGFEYEGPMRTYTLPQVAFASFVGSPIGGFWLLIANSHARGKLRTAQRETEAAIVVTAMVLAAAFALPASVPAVLIPVIYTIAITAYAAVRQRSADDVRNVPRPRQSHWRVLAISAAGLAAMVLCIVGVEAAVRLLRR